NNENIALVSDKLLNYLSSTTQYYIETEVATKLTELAEKYAPDLMWYIETTNKVLELAARCVQPQVIHNLMKMISTAENDVKQETVLRYVDLISKKCLP
ncbi:hypothetical protein, partial [Salmonella sp. s51933]|uniref:hypothetical protein n=1 Tax=Salmonella sp. s51933 TaxID=3160127 RepID=UPI003754196C